MKMRIGPHWGATLSIDTTLALARATGRQWQATRDGATSPYGGEPDR